MERDEQNEKLRKELSGGSRFFNLSAFLADLDQRVREQAERIEELEAHANVNFPLQPPFPRPPSTRPAHYGEGKMGRKRRE